VHFNCAIRTTPFHECSFKKCFFGTSEGQSLEATVRDLTKRNASSCGAGRHGFAEHSSENTYSEGMTFGRRIGVCGASSLSFVLRPHSHLFEAEEFTVSFL
jgi:hypothetical protein